MSDIPLSYTIAVQGFRFRVREIEGSEELSKPFRIHAWFALDHQTMVGVPDEFDPDDIVKQDATVILERDGAVQRQIKGIVSEVELSATISGVPEVNMIIEPRFSILRHRHDVRIHRNMTVPEIVTEVCEALGVKIDNRLTSAYDSRPYCVQWRETDFDYCNRLLEDEGIFYFFTQDDVMVLGDAPDAYDAGPTLLFRSAAGVNQHDDAIHEIGTRASLSPGKVTLRDWNTEHPSLDMDVSHETAMPFSCEWYDYPGEYEEPGEGARKARLHAEAFDRAHAATKGKTTCGLLAPGIVFKVVDTPMGAEDGGFVTRKIVHRWHENDHDYEVAFEADQENITYRPPRETFVPRIFNPMTGFVVMEHPGQDIHCDHFGRVKIHFPWDRIQPKDANCSHWIPTIQDNTGGSSAIPREGWEMMVHFLEGDPDRPVVLGRVYNGEDKFSEKLPHAKDRSGLKSFTTPSREGANEIRLEDKSGIERIFVHAVKDQLVNIANDLNQNVDNTATTTVKHDESETIGGDANWTIGDDFEPMVMNDQTWSVTGNRVIKIGKTNASNIGNDHTMKITGNHERKIFSDDNLSAKTMTEDITGGLTEKFKKVHMTEVAKLCELSVKGSYLEESKVNKAETVTEERTDTVKGMHIIMCDEEFQCRVDNRRYTKIEGSYLAMVGKITNLTGAKELNTHSNTLTLNGSESITMKVGDSEVVFKGGVLKLKSKTSVKFTVSGPSNHNATVSKQG